MFAFSCLLLQCFKLIEAVGSEDWKANISVGLVVKAPRGLDSDSYRQSRGFFFFFKFCCCLFVNLFLCCPNKLCIIPRFECNVILSNIPVRVL